MTKNLICYWCKEKIPLPSTYIVHTSEEHLDKYECVDCFVYDYVGL